jgi:hypothetical protein
MTAEGPTPFLAAQPTVKSEANKADSGKLPLDLLPPELLINVAQVLRHGAEKYDRYNWAKGMAWSRVYAAAQRHLLKWWTHHEADEDSGLSHLAHAACCLAFLLAYEDRRLGIDDRPLTI